MDKMSDNKQVKKYYMKAIMMMHPDKISQDQNTDKIYIANRCFAALNEAFNEFKNEPGVNI
jgi:DnaJ-class molecular chaperone